MKLLNILFINPNIPVSAENFADERNLTENLCRKLKEKHAGCPVIFFLDENDISTAENLSSKSFLKNLTDFHIISAFVENLVRLRCTGFDFDEMEFCRNIGRSMREDVSLKCENKLFEIKLTRSYMPVNHHPQK